MTYVQARTTPGLQTPGGLEYTLIWGVSVLLVPDISHGKDPMLRQGCTLQEAGSREGTGTVLQSSAEDRAAAGGQDICCEWFPPGQGQHPGAIERPHRCTAVSPSRLRLLLYPGLHQSCPLLVLVQCVTLTMIHLCFCGGHVGSWEEDW